MYKQSGRMVGVPVYDFVYGLRVATSSNKSTSCHFYDLPLHPIKSVFEMIWFRLSRKNPVR